jgi:hypothetical protein
MNAPESNFEHHPNIFPNRDGSMIPFEIQLLRAELPHLQGNSALTLQNLTGMIGPIFLADLLRS